MQINLSQEEFEKLIPIVLKHDIDLALRLQEEHTKAIKRTKWTKKRSAGAANATAIREKRAKKAITDAVNMLRLYNKPITKAEVHRESGVSRNTINKYWDQIVS